MLDLGLLDKKDYDEAAPRIIRESARAIVFAEDKIALIFIESEGAYAFPGGSREARETMAEALAREVREEAGLIVRPETIQPFGRIVEIRKDLFVDGIFEQCDFYFTCAVEAESKAPCLNKHEAEDGYRLEIVSLADAIETNERAIKAGKHYLEREATVLRFLQSQRQTGFGCGAKDAPLLDHASGVLA